MEIKVYKADGMRYTLFSGRDNDLFFAKYGIRFTHEINDCDLILSRFFFVLENYARFHGTNKKYLLWTHEPRIDTHIKNIAFSNNVPIDIMNVYTGDVFTNNYLYAHCLKKEIKSISYSEKDLKNRKIAIIASYNKEYFNQTIGEEKNFDLCQLRAEIALAGHALGKVDIYGRGWPNNVSLENSRFQVKNTEQFWGDRKLDILQQYNFNLCFENSTVNYYCSEKIWHSIMTGCLPIYYGEGNAIYEDFPRESFIDYCDFNSPQELFNYIDKIEADEYNERMNRCIKTANRIFHNNSYTLAWSQMLDNTVSKIQTITGNKQADEEAIESIIENYGLSDDNNVALNKPTQQSSTSRYSKPNDSQGGVNGVKSGRYNFHTDFEVNPWWQVDLEQVYEVKEIRVYNRLDSCSERAASLKMFVSINGKLWKPAYENNPNYIFGGIDGNPLVVPLHDEKARYVRIQLNAIEALHLDQVEVYAT